MALPQEMSLALEQVEAVIQRGQELVSDGSALRDTLQRMDTQIPDDVIVTVRPGENVQMAMNSLNDTGGFLDLLPGHHDFAPILSPRAQAPRIVIRGMSEDPTATTLRGFLGLPRSHNVTLQRLMFVDPVNSSHVKLGGDRSEMTTVDVIPTGFVLDTIVARRGTDASAVRRGLAANCGDWLVTNSRFEGYYHSSGADSQAICAWNGSYNGQVLDSFLEAASENFATGGADPANEAMIPRDILVRGNRMSKRQEWMGAGYALKCLAELKNGLRIQIIENDLDGSFPDSWADAPACVFKCVNQDNTAPWSRLEDILCERNRIRNVGTFLRIVGRNDGPYVSGIGRGFIVRWNRVESMHTINLPPPGAPNRGRAIAIIDGPEHVLVDHNTIVDARHSLIEISGIVPVAPIVVTNNVARHGVYGVRPGGAPLVITHNALEVRSGTQPPWPIPPGSGNVYYPAPIASQDLSGHVTSDGAPVGA